RPTTSSASSSSDPTPDTDPSARRAIRPRDVVHAKLGHARAVRSLSARGEAAGLLEPDGAGWRHRLFGRAAEQHFQRRTSDWLRLAAGVVVLIVVARHSGDVTASERAVYDLLVSVPDQLDTLFLALYRLGALWAVGLVVAAALVARRIRLGRDLLVAGVVA